MCNKILKKSNSDRIDEIHWQDLQIGYIGIEGEKESRIKTQVYSDRKEPEGTEVGAWKDANTSVKTVTCDNLEGRKCTV